MIRIFGNSVVLLGALGMMTMGCGDDGKDTGDTGSTSTTTTGTATGTTTGTATTPETTGFTRLVHLVADVPEIDVFLFDDPAPLGTFPLGGNSDAEGTGYLPFPPMDYTVRATNTSTNEELVVLETALALHVSQTKNLTGFALKLKVILPSHSRTWHFLFHRLLPVVLLRLSFPLPRCAAAPCRSGLPRSCCVRTP